MDVCRGAFALAIVGGLSLSGKLTAASEEGLGVEIFSPVDAARSLEAGETVVRFEVSFDEVVDSSLVEGGRVDIRLNGKFPQK